MLVVITIMLMLVAAATTMMRPDVEGRRVREAARSINVYLGSARNRAIETGLPCGVTFHNFAAPGFSMNADQCEVPPCYCGESETSSRTVTASTYLSCAHGQRAHSAGGTATTLPNGLIRPGDAIQFN